MRHRRTLAIPATAAAVVAGLALNASAGAAASGSGAVTLKGSRPAAAATTPHAGSVSPGSRIDFEVQLRPSDLSGAQALAKAVSTPGSASYRKFLTPAQWERRFSPTAGQVTEVSRFLKGGGFNVGKVSADRMAIDASGTAGQIERAFSTSLSYHRVQGAKLRLNDRALSVPRALSGIVAGVTGIDQTLARPFSTTDNSAPSASGAGSAPPPPGFRVAPPCGRYYNQKIDTTLPPYDHGYPANPPWATCGYTPPQFRSAYHLSGGSDGSGVTVAIVDAYASPTLFDDAKHYASINDPSHPLAASQFSEVLAHKFNYADLCGPSGWYGEQTLDVEAVHATAPGAHILFAGAENCAQGDLTAMVRNIVDNHLANVITNSYGDPAGDLLDSESVRAATDNTLLMAAGTGISVLFSSGDWEDNYPLVGTAAPTYPASSPWATGIGGTTLKINEAGQRFGELGWSTAKSYLCNSTYIRLGGCTDAQAGTWLPINLSLGGGSGGGTSFVYPQPDYQAGVVPTSFSRAHGADPMRVEPDISMDADPATGMLVGETQTFPNGVYYDQYRIGGTSLSSPLMAGVIARADGTAGHSLGFLNPRLYALHGHSGSLFDILPAGRQDQSRADFANSLNDADGFLYSTRIIDYEGPEAFCNAENHCQTRAFSLHTAPGYDNMTGLGSPGEQFLSDLTAGH
ncbi:MAG: S53 family peptidase [Actinomycetota bacterium]|nr:S53 family peptidase [Actinomycetota bacterium]